MATVGIDLGTTNSLVSHFKDGVPELIPNALGDVLTPSAVSVGDGGEIVIGRPALDRLQTHPQRTAATFKRAMGTSKLFQLGEQAFRAEELSSLVLRALKADAQATLGEPVSGAVITVPAYFSDAQRNATRIAGELAGLEVLRLINEPTAAAIAYGVHEKPDFSTVLVLDLGGGTFDVTALEMFEGVMQVHASAGDNFLGGEDFSNAAVDAFLEQHDIQADGLNAAECSDLLRAAERFKRQLSSTESATLRVVYRGAELVAEWSRSEFEQMCEPLIRRIRRPVERTLRDASLEVSDLDGVILVGGASRMMMLRSLTAKMLGKLPLVHVNPDEIVARGAAVQVALMQGNAALDEVVLTDVAPYSLGIGIYNRAARSDDDDRFSPIIERNSPVPVSRAQSYRTVSDGQTVIELNIFQGEARRVLDNIKLGSLTIGVPRGKAGEQSVEVRFTYDINGLLEVEVQVESTGRMERLVLQRDEDPMSEEQIGKRLEELAHLKVHPREDMENAAALARAERLYQERLGDQREVIETWLAQFEAVLETQDRRQIEDARQSFVAALDSLESSILY